MGYNTMVAWKRIHDREEVDEEHQESKCKPAPLQVPSTLKCCRSQSLPVSVTSNDDNDAQSTPPPSFQEATMSWSPSQSPRAMTFKTSISRSPESLSRTESLLSYSSSDLRRASAKQKNLTVDMLFMAACAGDIEHVRRLLIMGAPVNSGYMVHGLYEAFTPSKSGVLSPLAGAAYHGRAEIVELLLSHGAEINPRHCHSSSSPLHMACRNDDSRISRILLEAGADVDIANAYLATPLMYAAKYGSDTLMELILDFCPDLSRKSFVQTAAIHWATAAGRMSNVEILLLAGADPNHRMGDEGTPLHCAAMYGHWDIARCLLFYGANASLRNQDYLTSVQIAEQFGYDQIALILRASYPNTKASSLV